MSCGGPIDHRQSTGHAERLTGDVVRQIAGEEQNGVRDICRLAEPPHRNGALERLQVALRQNHQHRSFGRPRTHAIHVDRIARHLAGQPLAEGDQAALRAGIDGFARTADTPGVACDVDDLARPSINHRPEQRAREFDRSQHIDVDDAFPKCRIIVDERLSFAEAGAIHQDMNLAATQHEFCKGGNRLIGCDIDLHEAGRQIASSKPLGLLLALVGGKIGNDDVRASAGKDLGGRTTDTGCGTRDHGGFSFEPHV